MYEEYEEVARAMGLRLSPEDPGWLSTSITLEGLVDGVPVRLVRTVGDGAVITTTVRFPHVLDLGLRVTSADWLTTLLELVAPEVKIGDPGFDAAFAVRGDEAPRVAALLTSDVREVLGRFHRSKIELTDKHCESTLSVQYESPESLSLELRNVSLLAWMLEGARLALPPASVVRAHYETLLPFARTHSLGISATPLLMQGRLGATLLRVTASRSWLDDRWSLDLWVRSERAEELDVYVVPRSKGIARVDQLGLPELPTGDAAFDAAFFVRPYTSRTATNVLQPETRRRLLELSPRGATRFGRDGVTFSAPLSKLAAPEILLLLEDLRELAESQAIPTDPYR